MAFAPKTPTKPAAKAAQAAQKAPVSAARAAPAPTPANIAVRSSGALALPADLLAELGAHAKEAAAKERPSISRISLKSGVMQYQQQPLPGNNLDVIIIGGAYRNVFYAGRYDPDNIVNPNCFALADESEGMQAHDNVPDANVPADEDGAARETPRACAGCAMGAWNSDPNGGRGKACKQTRRLVLLPASVLDEEGDVVDNILKSEMALLDIPVTSVKNYGNLVNSLAATIGLPVWAVKTNISVTPDARTQFKVNFTPLEPAGGEEVIRALMKRRDEALRISLQPFDGVGGEADPAAAESKPQAPVKNKFAAKAAPRR